MSKECFKLPFKMSVSNQFIWSASNLSFNHFCIFQTCLYFHMFWLVYHICSEISMVPGNLFLPSTIIRSALGLLFYDTRLKYRLGSFFCLPVVENQTKLRNLPYTCVSLFFIMVFIRDYKSIEFISTLRFLELQILKQAYQYL